jgi:hypothetical protein
MMFNILMSEDKYAEALHEAQAELAKLDERRQTLVRLISDLKALSGSDAYELTPPPGYVPKGLTEEIRTILNLTTVPLDPMQIRDSMLHRGFESSNPKNLLISVHTVLKRIEAELHKGERDGKPTYIAKVRTFDPAYHHMNPPVVSEAARSALPPPPGQSYSSSQRQITIHAVKKSRAEGLLPPPDFKRKK